MNRRLRFRFSLATLLIAMAWSVVVVWMNVTPRVGDVENLDAELAGIRVTKIEPHLYDDEATEQHFRYFAARYGFPRTFAESSFLGDCDRPRPPRRVPSRIHSYGALAGDIAVGLLLVAVLTWGSNQLLRRIGARLRRRKAVEEQT